jgi:GT2 family glycosyltransferase
MTRHVLPPTPAAGAQAQALATIVITTRNRCDDVLRAVASSFAQDLADLEVIVVDDHSDDGTAERVCAAFPRTRMIVSRERAGYIVARNRAFREARGRYVFSLDDDAYFTAPDIVARVVSQLEADRAIGAVAIPFIEPMAHRSRSSLAHSSLSKAGDELRSYVGCAHALRRDVALALGGYREFFVHQGEERDLCLRMRAAGWRVVAGDCGLIVHMVSPKREAGRISHYGIRNQILFETLNAPLARLPLRLVSTVAGAVRYRFSWPTLPAKLRAIGAGIAWSARRISERKPVPDAVYCANRSLPYHGPEDWDGDLPPPCSNLQAVA